MYHAKILQKQKQLADLATLGSYVGIGGIVLHGTYSLTHGFPVLGFAEILTGAVLRLYQISGTTASSYAKQVELYAKDLEQKAMLKNKELTDKL